MEEYLNSIKKRFAYYREIGLKAIEQIPEDKLFWQLNEESNSIGIIVNHLHGNMISRWTNFLTEDGEKDWRSRDAEFENDINSHQQLLEKWNDGWNCLFNAIENLTVEDLTVQITIRNEKHSVIDAINRQLTHYAYHIGQIIFLAKMIQNDKWQTLSIPKGKSKEFNDEMKNKLNREKI